MTSQLGATVAVILCYYNGQNFLPKQLSSIANQTHRVSKIFISDDGSDVKISQKILDKHSNVSNNISLNVRNTNIGCTKNYLKTLSDIEQDFQFYAFSDQDDIWHKDKITDALAVLTQYPDDRPALYCARTTITDETCEIVLGTSPLFTRPPSFKNAIIQNIGGGNTMMFNKAARDLIVASSLDTDVVAHDWWCYQIISGVGGIVHWDPKPCLKYRQHSKNLVGSNNDWPARRLRLQRLLSGYFFSWNDINLAALSKNRSLLTPVNQSGLDKFIRARQSGLFRRLFLFQRSGIYRQTLLGNLGLFVGLIINKV